jgi:hypothetical protein
VVDKRALSAALKAQLFSPYRDKDYRVLVTVDHRTFDDPFRFVSGDPTEFATLVSNGETFTTFPFEITLLSDDDSDPQAVIRLQNADDRIGSTLLALPNDAVTLTIQVVLRETPNTIEYEAVNLELVDVEVDAMAISARIVSRGAVSEPCPGRVLTNRISPVFFR